MKTICIDTSHRHLVLVLLEDEKIVASHVQEAWKKQSETIFVELISLMNQVLWKVDDIKRFVITKGPGSYTGIRIAMSIAKVLCTQKEIELYTISTLQLYAGVQNVYVMLDARSNRAYFGNLENGELKQCAIHTLEELSVMNEKTFVGDTDLIGITKTEIDFAQNFQDLQEHFEKVANIHALTPEYLKEESAYLVK